jgi:hypothetical protein
VADEFLSFVSELLNFIELDIEIQGKFFSVWNVLFSGTNKKTEPEAQYFQNVESSCSEGFGEKLACRKLMLPIFLAAKFRSWKIEARR